VVSLLAQEIGELFAQGKVLLSNEDCAHASRPMTMMSLPDLFPFDRNGMPPPFWSLRATDVTGAASV
jgi:hypothetical protein